jgi:hypothetical protein
MMNKIWKMCVVGLMLAAPVICAGSEISHAVKGANDGTYVVIDNGEWLRLSFAFIDVPDYPAVKLTFSSIDSGSYITVSYYDEGGQLIDMGDINPNSYPGSDLASNPYVAAPPTFASMRIEVAGSTVSLDAAEFVNHYDSQEDVLRGTCVDGTGADGVEVVSPIVVSIDIKPGTYPNPINQGSNGLIPVAILTTEAFDASTVDAESVTLNGAKVAVRGKSDRLMARLEDVDGDGDMDLLLQVDTQSEGVEWTTGAVTLTGTAGVDADGKTIFIQGFDDVVIVPAE